MIAASARPLARILIAACVLASLAAQAIPVAAVSVDVLGTLLVDAALVTHADGSAPDVLTLDTENVATGSVHVALLRRHATGWSRLADATISLTDALDGLNQPALADLGQGQFAILASQASQPGASIVTPLTVVTTGERGELTVGASIPITGTVANAGAADVDGDGTNELIVTTSTDGDADGRCSDATIRVFSTGATGWHESDHRVKIGNGGPVRVTAAAFGRFDDRKGADLLAHVYETCGPSPDIPDQHHLVGIRLADGSIIKDLRSSDEESANIVPTDPIVLDVDGDGRDEAVVMGVNELHVIDPSDGWKWLPITQEDSRLLSARAGSPTGGATVTWLGPVGGAGAKIQTARIRRVGRTLVAADASVVALPDQAPGRPDELSARLQYDIGTTGSASLSKIDLDGDDCPELILPSVVADCLGTGVIRPGPSWYDTRPLAVVGPPAERRLLVAEGLDWYPAPDGPYPPTPSAATPGAWRDAYSSSFYLDDVALPLGGLDRPVPTPVIDPLADKSGSIGLHGPAGARLLFRVDPIRPDDISASPPSVGPMSLRDFTRGDQAENEAVYSRRLPTEPGSGGALADLPFAIASEMASQPSRKQVLPAADHWTLAAVALDAYGELSSVARTTVAYDQTAPPLSLAPAPFLSPPWPFEARIAGTTEPGAIVRLGDAAPITVGASGAFEIGTQLAPWPQTLEVTATDPSGNATPTSVSIMGGIDARTMPWPAIAAVAIIIAVTLSSLRGTRRVRGISPAVTASDEGGDLVIEELDPGSTFRRD